MRQPKRCLVRGGLATTLTLTRANREETAWRVNIGFKNLAVTKTEPELGSDSVLGIDRDVAVLVAGAGSADFASGPAQLLRHGEDLEQRLHTLRRRVETLQVERAMYKKHREVFYCGNCGHYEHADVNAARNIRGLGLAADAAWVAKGSPLPASPDSNRAGTALGHSRVVADSRRDCPQSLSRSRRGWPGREPGASR